MFDAPIPGQSLTDEPGNYPWEHPPQTASIEEAADAVYESIMDKENMARMFTHTNGHTIETCGKSYNVLRIFRR